MNADNLDVRLLRFRSRRDEYPLALAMTLLEARRLSEALEVVRIGLAEGADDPALLVLEGRVCFEQGDLPQAQAALMRAAKLNPRDKDPYRWLAQVLMKRGEPARAVQVLERALQLDPQDRILRQTHERAKRLARIADASDAGLNDQRPLGPRETSQRPLPPRERVRERVHASSSNADENAASPARPASSARAGSLPPPGARLLPGLGAARLPPPVVPARHPGSSRPVIAGAGRPSPQLPVPPQPMQLPVPPQPILSPAADLRRETHSDTTCPGTHATDRPRQADLRRETHSDTTDDEPTLATEVPAEISSWLATERGAEPLPEEPTRRARDPQLDTVAHGLTASPPANSMDWAETATSSALGAGARDEAKPEPVWSDESTHEVPIEALQSASGAEWMGQPFTQAEPVDDAAPAQPDAIAVSQPDPPEQVLQVLARQGIYEASKRSDLSETWVPRAEAPRAGQRIGSGLALSWVLALAAAGGGYYGFTRWVEGRRSDAAGLVEDAEALVRDGQYASLLAAERDLTRARALDPKSAAALDMLLFVHAARVLEDASGELGYLRGSLARVRAQGGAAGLTAAAEAVVKGYEGDAAGARAVAEVALDEGAEDARVLYLVGRLYQQAGDPAAGALLARASEREPQWALAWLAQAELARQHGDLEAARRLLDKARGPDGEALRAELWQIVLDTSPERADALLKALDPLRDRVEQGAAADQLLAAIARAGLALAADQKDAAREAVRSGGRLNVRDPELLLLLGQRAMAAGELQVAYRALHAATRAAPSVTRYRDALVEVLLRRGDGRVALALLQGAQGGPAALGRARAALLAGDRTSLGSAKKELMAYRAEIEGPEREATALLMRIDSQLGASAESLLPAAQSLTQRAPGSGAAWLALAELALGARQAATALKASQRAVELSPADGDVLYLRGRALRLAGQPEAALAALEEAALAAPQHPQAREALAFARLDAGQYDAARALFDALVNEGYGLGPKLGLIEAEIGRGELSAAAQQLGEVTAQTPVPAAVRVTEARLLLAKGRAGEAAKLLDPLVQDGEETRSADLLALHGDALYAAGRVDSAAGAYDAALELDPEHPDALVGRAVAAVRAEKGGQALGFLTRAAQALRTRIRPPLLRAQLLLAGGKAAMLEGQFERARSQLAEAIEIEGVPPEALFWYAEALARTKSPGASDYYAMYLERAPRGDYASRAKRALAPR